MTWVNQMLDCIKQGKTRMEIAAELDVPVGIISKYANVLARTHEYRDAGISDNEYAYWQEASLIGLRTADGELVITRTKPDAEKVKFNLRGLQQAIKIDDSNYDQATSYMLQGYRVKLDFSKLKNQRPARVIRHCNNCVKRGDYSFCPWSFEANHADKCKLFSVFMR